MACDLGIEYTFAPAVLGSMRMDRQGLPVSQVGRREDSELLAKLAAQLRVDAQGHSSGEQCTFYSASYCHICAHRGPHSYLTTRNVSSDTGQASIAHDRSRGIEREQLPQQHYVSKAPSTAPDGGGSGPLEDEQCNEHQEAGNDEGGSLSNVETIFRAPQGAMLLYKEISSDLARMSGIKREIFNICLSSDFFYTRLRHLLV